MGLYNTTALRRKIVNEVYFGETPGIMSCFNAFAAWRSKYVMAQKVYMMNMNADSDPLKSKFIAEIEREFGLYSFSFMIVNLDQVNAFTIMPAINVNCKLRGANRVEFRKDGYRFKKECQVSILTFCFAGLFFNNEISNREVFAILLHEIGHNFQDLISDKMNTLGTASTIYRVIRIIADLIINKQLPSVLYALSIDAVGNVVSKALNNLTLEDQNNIINYMNIIYGVFANTIKLGTDTLHAFGFILNPVGIYTNVAKNLVIQFLGKIISAPVAVHDYYGEVSADKFAAHYGFAADLNTGLNAMTVGAGMQAYYDKIPILAHYNALMMLPIETVAYAIDEHPRLSVRCKNTIKSLETDLNDPRISPKLKKQLKADLDKTKATTDQMFKETSKIDNPSFASMMLESFFFHIMGGDLKHKLSELILDTDKSQNDTFVKQTNFVKNVKLK